MRAVGGGDSWCRSKRKVQSTWVHLVHLSLPGSPCEEGDSHRVFEEDTMSRTLLLAFKFWQFKSEKKSAKNQSHW